MLKTHYQKYLEARFTLRVIEEIDDRIKEGELTSKENGQIYPIRGFIPRFVENSNYCDNFGIQWNRFKNAQLDSKNGQHHSFTRFWTSSRWHPKDLFGKTVLEVGSGAGRFTEVLLNAGADVVSFDFSNAVEANHENNRSDRLFLFQGDLYILPLSQRSFDYVVCYGVLQHTPRAKEAFHSILEYLKPGGRFSIDHYRKVWWPNPWYQPKYIWRPLTTKMNPKTLLRIIQSYIPLWLPLDTFIKKIPKLGMTLAGLIPVPCWNYMNMGLSYSERVEWAVMDTFDALGAAYDTPRSREEIQNWCDQSYLDQIDVFFGGNGIVANGRRISA